MAAEVRIPKATQGAVAGLAARGGPVLVLTGAGISAESGIPTFRGPEGFWRVGSRNYLPQELATAAAFARMPEALWTWYLHRRGVCAAAAPNPAHAALVRLERELRSRFLLVTQNVDGLHARAGQERVLEIHGNLHLARCAAGCGHGPAPLPAGLPQTLARDTALDRAALDLLRCPRCGAWLRPHVLWFDESYREDLYRSESALAAAARAELLVVIGTSGATTLPARIVGEVARRGRPIVAVDPEPGPFPEAAQWTPGGAFLRGRAAELVPALVAVLTGAESGA